jgi:hypothetical protein
LRSSPSEIRAFVSRSRVTWDAPNCIFTMPAAVSFPRTRTSWSRTSWATLERPRAVERRVQARDHRVALDVVEDAVPALPLLDLGRVEGLLEECAVHGGHLRS